MDQVACRHGVGQPLQGHHATAFAPPIAVGIGGKTFAAAVGGDCLNEASIHGRMGAEVQMDAAGQSKIAFSGLERL